MSIRSSWWMVLFRPTIFLLIFLTAWPISYWEKGVKVYSRVVDLSISPCISVIFFPCVLGHCAAKSVPVKNCYVFLENKILHCYIIVFFLPKNFPSSEVCLSKIKIATTILFLISVSMEQLFLSLLTYLSLYI